MSTSKSSFGYPKFLVILEILALIITGYMGYQRDFFTYCLEVTPAIIGLIILLATYKKFKFSNFIYTLLFIHSLVLMYGGIYTYALAPLGEAMKHWFGFERNNYDKIGHFMQGFVPVLVAREYFIRRSVIASKKWLAWLAIGLTLAFSAFYEMIEWWVSVSTGSAGDSFLGTQGYVWDTQSDMLMCLIGSIVAILLMARIHDKVIARLRAGK